MLEPRSRRVRSLRLVAVGLLAPIGLVMGSGCSSSPQVATGTFAEQQQRIVELVNATGAAIGAPAQFKAAHTANPLPCYKKMLGYTVKHLAANHAEVPVLIDITGDARGPQLLPRVEHYWRSRGYAIDSSGLSDPRFPKIRAHVGDDLLVATGYAAGHEMTLYGLTPCVKK
jgi:hypothetical protein